MASFMILRWHSFAKAGARREIIVYQVPGYQAVDFVRGRDHYFMADTALLLDSDLCNYYLRPTRIQNRLADIGLDLPVPGNKPIFHFAGKSVMLINQHFLNPDPSVPLRADIAIVSGNPGINLRKLPHKPEIRQIVLDGSVPRWKSKSLREDCDALGIACHDVNLTGAFELQIR
jgi:competence protein ComEC